MKVEVRHGVKNVCHSNIIWKERWPMMRGVFPKGHPCASGDTFSAQMGAAENIVRFRERGYWASCFPEGDGITFQAPSDKSPKQVENDIRECFGFEVVE